LVNSLNAFQRFSGSSALPLAWTTCYTPPCLVAARAGYTLPDPTAQSSQGSTSLAMTKANGDEVGHVLYDAYGAVLTSTVPATLTTTMAGSGDVPDPDTGLVYLGDGRWYDPALGRPLQPNPVGGPPTLPQALNRYSPTPWGPPGVTEGADSIAVSPSAWLGMAGNATLEILGRTVFLKPPHLAFQGSALAVKKGLAGLAAKGVPFEVTVAGTKGGVWGELALGLSGRIPFIGERVQGELAERLVILEAATTWPVMRRTGERLLFEGIGEFNPTRVGLRTTRYQAGLLLRQSRLASAAASMGLTFVIDVGVETYGAATGSGRWGNPYWTTGQKGIQASLVVGSDVLLAGGLVLAGVNWYWTIPIAFAWAVIAEPVVFQNVFPGLYQENRNLKPLLSGE
jgi:hypothetical protein